MSLRDRQRESTRALLLATARRLIAENGPDGVTTREIAGIADVAIGTFFAHFPDKTALLEALLHDHIEGALNHAFATLPTTGAIDALVHVASILFDAYDREPALSRALLSTTLFLSDPERPLAVQLRRFEGWVGARLVADLEAGALRPIDPRLAFVSFFSLYFGLLVGGLRGDLTGKDRVSLLRAGLERLLAAEVL